MFTEGRKQSEGQNTQVSRPDWRPVSSELELHEVLPWDAERGGRRGRAEAEATETEGAT